jgi:general secretion pathway protein A
MYLHHWKLACRPFDKQDDARFYYPSETHQAALLKLHYAIENRQGSGLLAGMSGLGKSLLIRALFDSLAEVCQPQIHLRFPQLSPASLVSYLAVELTGQPSDGRSMDVALRCIETFLADSARQGRHPLIVIDEAHLLCGTDTMETLRLLLNYEPVWTVVLAGQPALLPALQRMPELEERLGVKCLLRRLSLRTRPLPISAIGSAPQAQPTSMRSSNHRHWKRSTNAPTVFPARSTAWPIWPY